MNESKSGRFDQWFSMALFVAGFPLFVFAAAWVIARLMDGIDRSIRDDPAMQWPYLSRF